jgi:hypothetical protein
MTVTGGDTVSSSADIRKKIANIAAKRAVLERQISDASRSHAAKNTEHAKKTEQAAKASSDSIRRSYLRQADSALKAALSEGDKIADLSKKLAALGKDDGTQQKALGDAIKREAADQEARAKKARQVEERQRAEHRRADERRAAEQRREDQRRQDRARAEDRSHAQALVGSAEQRLTELLDAATRPPKKEELRILYVTANPHGDLRVDEEIRRVKAVVRASTHRDQVLMETLSAATPGDLLDGLTSFRPHVVHFSGHSDDTALTFDDGGNEHGPGKTVTARAFKAAVEAPDEPPRLVVLNSCESAAQLTALLGKVPTAIGMSDSIGDPDALTFATRFYRSLAEGQSVQASLETARADMKMNGLPDHDLPVLEALPGVDAAQVRLVVVPE